MPKHAAITGLVFGVRLFLTGGCGSSNSPTTPTTDFVALESPPVQSSARPS